MTQESVWEALVDSEGQVDRMTVKSRLMREIRRAVKAWDIPQVEAASKLGITQPRLSELINGKIDKFSLDALVLLLKPAGLKISVSITSETGS